MKAREHRDYSVLVKASEHLDYEIEMLEVTSKMLDSGRLENYLHNKNAVIESLAIHIRTVLKFFFDDSPRKTDVVAEDFCDDGKEWLRLTENLRSQVDMAGTLKRVSKEVAHLTYNRLDVSPQEKDWRTTTDLLLPICRRALGRFLKTVPYEKLCEPLRQKKSGLESGRP